MNNQYCRVKHYIIAVIFIAAGVFLDQITKYFALIRLKDREPYIIIKDVFHLEYLERGFFSSAAWLLSAWLSSGFTCMFPWKNVIFL